MQIKRSCSLEETAFDFVRTDPNGLACSILFPPTLIDYSRSREMTSADETSHIDLIFHASQTYKSDGEILPNVSGVLSMPGMSYGGVMCSNSFSNFAWHMTRRICPGFSLSCKDTLCTQRQNFCRSIDSMSSRIIASSAACDCGGNRVA